MFLRLCNLNKKKPHPVRWGKSGGEGGTAKLNIA
jgi:hypothetical protein